MDKITIDKDYLALALDYLRSKQDLEVDDQKVITKALQAQFNSSLVQLENLHREYTSIQNVDHSLYSPEEFKERKQKLLRERDDIENQLELSKGEVDKTLELSERTFNYCAYAQHHFNNGDLQTKRNIFSSIGSNLTLKDRKLNIQALEPYLLIEKELSRQKETLVALEPKNNRSIKRKTSASHAGVPHLLRE